MQLLRCWFLMGNGLMNKVTIKCPDCDYIIYSKSDHTDQAVVDIMCYHYATHFELNDTEADCG